MLAKGLICCGLHQVGFTSAASLLLESALPSGPDSPTPRPLLVAAPGAIAAPPLA
jgi:hypothetical protein